MKKITTILILIFVSTMTILAQTSVEKDVLKFIAAYDQAFIDRNPAFFEQNSVEEYKFYYNGMVRNRAQTIEAAKKDIATPTEKMISFKTASDDVRVNGSTAVVSGSWTWSAVPLSNPSGEPHVDNGRYTLILEKRGGRWMLVAEHQSEAAHDKKAMEAQVLKMGLAYNKMLTENDAAAVEKILADEFYYTTDKGKFLNKAEELANYKERQAKITLTETIDQKVRVIGNNAAVETGIFHIKGIEKDGKPFEIMDRYTTTWVWRDLRWQIVADHTSKIEGR